MQYGFAIDQGTCIGCHACTVACKTEHSVPVGQFRTWVKYVDSGTFPDTRRDMGVMRCNHCTDAPCVQICPTQALFKREDGIVDFDSDRCIGCKACMQACPYDAIHIDADTHTAAKCNFCAHRIDDGLEPACVVVCPTESIWVGDFHDPDSAISRFVASEETLTRSPEQGTGPNVHYVGANPAVLDPLAAPVDDTYIWAQPDRLRLAVAPDLRELQTSDARTTLNTAHPVPWGWRVSTYLWTKGVAGGALIAGAVGALAGTDLRSLGAWVAPVLAMAGLLATAAFLVVDLKRPERFWFLLDPRKANPSSWLVKGGLALSLGAGLAFVWFVLGVLGLDGTGLTVFTGLKVAAGISGALVAGYTAWLFGQAEGRDLWQSGWLLPHLVVQAVMVGSGALLALVPVAGLDGAATALLAVLTALGAVGHVAVVQVEMHGAHATDNARAAVHLISRGRHRTAYVVGLGLSALAALLALVVVVAPGSVVDAVGAVVAGLLVQVGLLLHEHVYVRAAQEVPLS